MAFGELIHDNTGEVLTMAEAQGRIRKTIERYGKFILNAPLMPPIGEVREYAGLPLKCVHHCTYEEALGNMARDIWGPSDELEPEDFFFEVVVAD